MTLLLHPKPAIVTKPDRSRWWYYQLWKYAPKRRYSPDEAAAIVAANWHLPSKRLRFDATYG